MNLSTKIGLALFLVLASALSMTTVLNYLRFDQTLHTLLAQRMTVILNETSQDIVAGIDLGLRLENMENLQPILNRRLDMSNDIRNVAVLDCDGTIISNAARSPDDQALSGAAIPQQARDEWIDFTPGIATAGQVLRDSLGQCAGQVVITASAETSEAKLANAFSEMWKSAALGMGMIIPILGVLFILMRRRHRVFEELHEDLARAVAGKAPNIRPHDGDVLTQSEIELISLYREIRDQLPHETKKGNTKRQSETPAEPLK
ncbi:hypothetical protein AUP42_08360 [Thalassospira lucentensis]|uniref:Uncharacterized protein n=1 Tax=Thalassospira lucentensis TaxID=168935 RepID=A0A154L001_9PROT|nr:MULTISPECIES: hypothetical protein [Thalassospira]KZB60556.1 hypothetical protein AUP42_08360 [Thalassospira lucentensis]MCH2276605.1 hypothetical protein [Thalassospira sp.]